MRNIYNELNDILMDWNPLDVPHYISIDEYSSYIPLILQSSQNRQKLLNCLEDILVCSMGMEYDRRNKNHVYKLMDVCDRIIKLLS